MIGFRTTDTNLQVIHNDAGTPAIYNDTGKSANTTSIQHLEIMADATNNRWLWRINTGGWTAVTTDIPEPLPSWDSYTVFRYRIQLLGHGTF